MDKSFCAHCGKELDAGTRFCIHCGAEQPPSPGSPSNAQQSVSPPAPGQYVPLQPSVVPAQKKRWPLFAGLGAAVVVVVAAVLLLTGVIKLGGGAPAFAAADINGEWSGTISLDTVSGSGSQAETLKAQIGDTNTMKFEITLDQNGKGTAESSGQSMSAELNGSTLTINGSISGGTFKSTGDIKKDGSSYSMSGNYSATQAGTGITISGKMTMRRSSAASAEMKTAEPAYSTPKPTTASTGMTALEGTYQYMYDEESKDIAGIKFNRDFTCEMTDTANDSSIPGTYVIAGNTLTLTLQSESESPRTRTFTIVIGTGRITLTDSNGSYDFVRTD